MALTSVNKEFYKPKDQPVGGSSFLELKYDPENGKAILEVYTVTGGVRGLSNTVYENGVWTLNAVITTTSEKETVHTKVKDAIKKAADQSKGVLPPFVVNNEPSKDFQGQGNAATPSQNNTGILGGIGNALFGSPEKEVNFTSFNENDLFGDVALLTYPKDILENKQDTFAISQYNYQAPGGDVFTKQNSYKALFTNTGLQRNSALKEFVGTVILPMPNKVLDRNGVNWGGGDSISSSNMAVAGYVYQNRAASAAGQAAAKGTRMILEAFAAAETDGLSALAGLDLSGAEKGLINAATTAAAGGAGLLGRADIGANISSLLLKNASYEIPPETILSRGFGLVPNSNLELLFNGPILRQFTFGYRMTPRSQEEARNVRRIIRFFKQGMAPRKKSGGKAGAGSAFLKTPNVFKLRYQSAGKSIPGVNKFKICALTTFGVDYTPESQWTAYEDPSSPGQPVSVVMNLQFSEIEPVYESDYQENIADIFNRTDGRGTDLDRVTNNDVGY